MSQLDSDISILVQEVFQNNTGEETAFVTAVDDTGNFTEDFVDIEETMQQSADGRYINNLYELAV